MKDSTEQKDWWAKLNPVIALLLSSIWGIGCYMTLEHTFNTEMDVLIKVGFSVVMFFSTFLNCYKEFEKILVYLINIVKIFFITTITLPLIASISSRDVFWIFLTMVVFLVVRFLIFYRRFILEKGNVNLFGHIVNIYSIEVKHVVGSLIVLGIICGQLPIFPYENTKIMTYWEYYAPFLTISVQLYIFLYPIQFFKLVIDLTKSVTETLFK